MSTMKSLILEAVVMYWSVSAMAMNMASIPRHNQLASRNAKPTVILGSDGAACKDTDVMATTRVPETAR